MSEIERIAAKVTENHYVFDFEAQNIVRTVLEAIREPTTDMCNAGTRSLALDWNICCDGRIAPDLWQIMIDELLK